MTSSSLTASVLDEKPQQLSRPFPVDDPSTEEPASRAGILSVKAPPLPWDPWEIETLVFAAWCFLARAAVASRGAASRTTPNEAPAISEASESETTVQAGECSNKHDCCGSASSSDSEEDSVVLESQHLAKLATTPGIGRASDWDPWETQAFALQAWRALAAAGASRRAALKSRQITFSGVAKSRSSSLHYDSEGSTAMDDDTSRSGDSSVDTDDGDSAPAAATRCVPPRLRKLSANAKTNKKQVRGEPAPASHGNGDGSALSMEKSILQQHEGTPVTRKFGSCTFCWADEEEDADLPPRKVFGLA